MAVKKNSILVIATGAALLTPQTMLASEQQKANVQTPAVSEGYDELTFLTDSRYLKQASTIEELEELLKDKEEWRSEGITLKEGSIDYAIKFIQDVSVEASNPEVEVHPDGEVAVTWRKQGTGIISIAFNEEGEAAWAAYLDGKQKQTVKGKFAVKDGLSFVAKNIIQEIG